MGKRGHKHVDAMSGGAVMSVETFPMSTKKAVGVQFSVQVVTQI